MQITIEISEDFAMPTEAIETDEAYLAAVLNNAVKSWQVHLGEETTAGAIAAARAEFNAQFAEEEG